MFKITAEEKEFILKRRTMASTWNENDRIIVNLHTKSDPEYYIGHITSIKSGKLFIEFDDGDTYKISEKSKKIFPGNKKKRKSEIPADKVDQYIAIEKPAEKPIKRTTSREPEKSSLPSGKGNLVVDIGLTKYFKKQSYGLSLKEGPAYNSWTWPITCRKILERFTGKVAGGWSKEDFKLGARSMLKQWNDKTPMEVKKDFKESKSGYVWQAPTTKLPWSATTLLTFCAKASAYLRSKKNSSDDGSKLGYSFFKELHSVISDINSKASVSSNKLNTLFSESGKTYVNIEEPGGKIAKYEAEAATFSRGKQGIRILEQRFTVGERVWLYSFKNRRYLGPLAIADAKKDRKKGSWKYLQGRRQWTKDFIVGKTLIIKRYK